MYTAASHVPACVATCRSFGLVVVPVAQLAAAQEQLLATGQALGAGVQTLLLLCK